MAGKAEGCDCAEMVPETEAGRGPGVPRDWMGEMPRDLQGQRGPLAGRPLDAPAGPVPPRRLERGFPLAVWAAVVRGHRHTPLSAISQLQRLAERRSPAESARILRSREWFFWICHGLAFPGLVARAAGRSTSARIGGLGGEGREAQSSFPYGNPFSAPASKGKSFTREEMLGDSLAS